jgi:hypothetical protein
MPLGMNGQDRTGGDADQFFGDAAQKHVRQTASTVSSDHDQVDLMLIDVVQYLFRRQPQFDAANGPTAVGPFVSQFPQQMQSSTLDVLFQIVVLRNGPRNPRGGDRMERIVNDMQGVVGNGSKWRRGAVEFGGAGLGTPSLQGNSRG